MPHLVIMVGLPGSGKSTWIKNFQAKQDTPYRVISSDDIIEREAAKQGKTYNEVFQDVAGSAGKQIHIDAKQAVNRGENVIWDQTNLTVKKRRSLLQKFPGYRCTAVNFVITDPVLDQRRAGRPGKIIPKHVLDGMARSYVSPTKDEGFDEVITVRD